MTKTNRLPYKGVITLLLITAVTVTVFLSWRQKADEYVPPPEEIEEYLFWKAKQLTDFTLMAAGNKPLNLDHLKGKWSFIFFGYTHCPDVCPVTLGSLGTTFKILEKNPTVFQEIQGIFVSVDPNRDTPDSLGKYVTYFHPNFSGVTGSTLQIDAITRQMGALYTIHSGESEDNYLVSHNSTIFVVDPRARLYGRLPPPHAPREIADIFIKIRNFYNEQEEKRWALF